MPSSFEVGKSLTCVKVPSEADIMSQWLDPRPVVSICCITYNHAAYIEDALKGFLIQKTDFAFEVLIHDDASTDDTANVIRAYERLYPNIIKPIYQVENQYSRGRKVSQLNYNRAAGRYMAICEGDDYWVDPLKLRKQVDFLETHPGCSMVFSGAVIKKEGGRSRAIRYPGLSEISPDVCVTGGYFMATASLVFRKELLLTPYEPWMLRSFASDFIIHYRALTLGNIGYVDAVTCVYRKNVPGSWSSSTVSMKTVRKEFKDDFRGLRYLQNNSGVSEQGVRAKHKMMRSYYRLRMALLLPAFCGLAYLVRHREVSSRILLVYLKYTFFPRW